MGNVLGGAEVEKSLSSIRIKRIGFPLISEGIFGNLSKQAWRKAVLTYKDFIGARRDYNMEIVCCSN